MFWPRLDRPCEILTPWLSSLLQSSSQHPLPSGDRLPSGLRFADWPLCPWASQAVLVVRNPTASAGDVGATSSITREWLSGEDPMEKGMATHSSILAWRNPWTEEPGGLQSTGLQSWTQLNSTHTQWWAAGSREKWEEQFPGVRRQEPALAPPWGWDLYQGPHHTTGQDHPGKEANWKHFLHGPRQQGSHSSREVPVAYFWRLTLQKPW